MNLTPPKDRVLLRQLAPETATGFGLVIPEIAQERPLRAEVLAVGAGVPHAVSGELIPLGEHLSLEEDYDDKGAFTGDAWYLRALEVGDLVVIPPYGGTEIELAEELGGGTVISILGSEILARVE